jgi:hypothetical protein
MGTTTDELRKNAEQDAKRRAVCARKYTSCFPCDRCGINCQFNEDPALGTIPLSEWDELDGYAPVEDDEFPHEERRA